MTDGAGDVRGYKQDRSARYGADIVTAAESMAAAPAWKNGHNAAVLLGVKSIQIHDLPDSRFDAVDILDMAHLMEAAIDRVRPDVVYTHYPGDLSVDHRRTAEAVITACRPKPGFPVREIYFFEVPSSTEWCLPLTFQPQLFVEVDYREKVSVLERAYGNEQRPFPHPRASTSLEALAKARGAQTGLKGAEAFMVGRILR